MYIDIEPVQRETTRKYQGRRGKMTQRCAREIARARERERTEKCAQKICHFRVYRVAKMHRMPQVAGHFL